MTDPADIYYWRRMDGRVTTSGQPSEAELGAIRALGVTHVVNLGLHSHEKALPDEAASVAALGMRYIHIPVDFDQPTEADYARFAATIAELAGETIHVHCIANMRVSAFFYRWRRRSRASMCNDNYGGWPTTIRMPVSVAWVWAGGGVCGRWP